MNRHSLFCILFGVLSAIIFIKPAYASDVFLPVVYSSVTETQPGGTIPAPQPVPQYPMPANVQRADGYMAIAASGELIGDDSSTGVYVQFCFDNTLCTPTDNEIGDLSSMDGKVTLQRGDVSVSYCKVESPCAYAVKVEPKPTISKTGRGYMRISNVTFSWCAQPSLGCKVSNQSGEYHNGKTSKYYYRDMTITVYPADVVAAAEVSE